MNVPRTALPLLVAALASSPRAGRAQEQTIDNGAACFGVSFDEGCGTMLQYEVGVRTGTGTMPHSRALAAGVDAGALSRVGTDWFVGGGFLVPSGPRSAIGVVAEAATDYSTRSIGIRYARHLRETARLDLTGGVVTLVAPAWNGQRYRGTRSFGIYADAALHATNYFTITARGDGYAPRGGLTGGSRVLVGGRFERGPALAATALAALLFGIALETFGNNW